MVYIVALSVALFAILLAIPQLFGSFMAYQIGLFLIYGIVAQGIGFLWGRTGILPLGQAMFFGISAYACARIMIGIESLPLQLGLLLVVIVCLALVGFGLAFIVFRSRADSGPFFSLITLALVMICEQIASTTPALTGGFNGLSGFSTIAGLDQFGSFYYVIAIAAVLSTALLLTIDRLPVGLIARAVADNERRLQLFGFPTHVVKGLAFALSAALAAVAGILFTNHQGIVTPTSTGFLLSANFVIWTAVGGRNHVLGPLIGAVAIGYLSSELRDSFAYWEVVIALLFIVIVIKAPGGFAELVARLISYILPARAKTHATINKLPTTKNDDARTAMKLTDCRLEIGSVRILNGVDFVTPEKGIVCVIGPNGAGKTSLLNVMTGGLPLTAGTIELGKDNIENRPSHLALGSGIARKLQVPSVFFSMSVFENLNIAMLAGRARWLDFLKPSALKWRSKELSSLLNSPSLVLQHVMGKPVSDLAQGHRQFLEFAMTTAAQPRVLLLDEPCAGLSPEETHLMTTMIREFQDQNQGLIILVEHDMAIVRSLADEVMVLHQGAVLAQGTYDQVSADDKVKAVYAGGTK